MGSRAGRERNNGAVSLQKSFYVEYNLRREEPRTRLLRRMTEGGWLKKDRSPAASFPLPPSPPNLSAVSEASSGLLTRSSSDSGIRNRYLSKIISPGVKRTKPETGTIVVFDWDDTLICTTYLKQLIDNKEKASAAIFKALDRQAVLAT